MEIRARDRFAAERRAMPWIDDILKGLAAETAWSYRAGGTLAAEPLSLAALALAGHGRTADAQRAGQRLASLASADGSVCPKLGEAAPGWPTGLAVLAWTAVANKTPDPFSDFLERGVAWLLASGGETSPRNADIGHDSSLRGWPWVQGTHSWIEPTATNVLALKATGRSEHPRTREAVRLLIDRLLPEGGCNYGNTTVFGQMLRPHLEPSGLALAALAGERDASGRIERTIAYLEQSLHRETTSMSLAYGLIGLAAHDRTPRAAEAWLESAAGRGGREAAPYKHALLALAALKGECPLIALSRTDVVQRRLSPGTHS
ncbi:MAG TPA: hypothetical protein VGN42_18425 [Pirellulales bacterium]|nr:hypothetical protein [Pirellulales bacterium]